MVMFQRLVRLIPLTCLLVVGFAHSGFASEPLQPRAEIGLKGGSDRSLMTTEFWAPLAQKRNQVLYADIRLMGDNDENREGNLGFGYRQVVDDYVLGGHAWIDRRRTQNNSTFHQMTFGAERLGHIIDLRANGYIPLNNTRTVITPNTGSTSPYLAGTGIYYDTNGFVVETPQYGMDGEIGIRLPIFKKYADTFRVYGGGYHFFRDSTENVTGIRLRTEAQINKAISLGARFQHDAARGSQGFLEATLKFPFSAKKLYQEDYIRSRLDESPERDVDIVTNTKKDTGLAKPVINTTTGQQQRVLYVDNTNTASGDGSKDNPFNTLAAAQAALQANDVLYINRGDGTTTGMDQGIVIDKANITLIGSGSNFVYDGNKFTAQTGNNFNGTLLAAATAAPVITNNQTFVDDGGGTITSYTGNGVFVTGANINISGITVSNAAAAGIYVLAEDAAINYDYVSITNVSTTGNINGRGIMVYALNGSLINNVNILENVSTNNIGTTVGRGIEIRLKDAKINNALLKENQTSGNSSHGLFVYAINNGHVDNSTIENNTSVMNGGNGIFNYAVNNSSIKNTSIKNNTSSNNSVYGIQSQASTNSLVNDVVIENNIIENNSNIGLYIVSNVSSTTGNISVNNNTINGSGSYGIYTYATTSGTIGTLTISGNTSSANASIGIYTYANQAGRIDTATIANNNVISNGSYGIYAYTNQTSQINTLTIHNNTTNQNTTAGIHVYAGASSQMGTVTITNNTSLNSTGTNGFGFWLRSLTDSTISNLFVSGNTASGGGHGIYINANDAQIQKASINNNILENNTTYGMRIYSQTATGNIQEITLSGNRIIGNTTNGLYLQKDASAILNVDLGGGAYGSIGQNNISGNIGNDIRLNYTGGGSVIARNNYWGGGSLTRVQLTAATTIDSSAFLTTAP